ncbi:MAG TPA: 1-deoxy-D-xylulose-5-phosphate reductoisomerase, partial [Eubacterium sp.]|nr:1-deoxy-D-xylulose-5-phosphate reductoisomerase [Eubacterium sp.]
LEVIEAKWLFGVDVDDIQVVVHPQSIIHSMVEYVDGAVIAQLGSPDMRLPIQYALFYPKRYPMDTDKLNFYDIAKLTFEEPDMKTFRGLALAYKVAREGGNRAVVFNAANEVCVAKFLRDEIGFLDIYDGIEKALEKIRFIENPTLEEIIATKDEVEEVLS